MITRRDWWIGVGVIVVALLGHALIPQYVPRYEWRHEVDDAWLRVDRWTGNAQLVITYPTLHTHFPLR